MRRLFLLVILLVLAGPLRAAPSILILGDSLSAGYGIDDTHGWAALLQQRLREQGYRHSVINASISGDTTLSGRERLAAAIARHRPAVVIVELGGNDGLRALPLTEIRANLDALIVTAQRAQAKVLLVGVQLPPNYGKRYTQGFRDLFAELAQQHDTALVPFLLEGVATKPGMMQPDGIHPTTMAQPRLLENVWTHLQPLL